jgi:hypothetical protein
MTGETIPWLSMKWSVLCTEHFSGTIQDRLE